MVSSGPYLGLLAAVALERGLELGISRRNAAWSFERGGLEYGRRHYAVMVALHGAFLAACAAEVVLLGRAFHAWIGVPSLALVVLAMALRWWCVAALGRRWNTRVIVVPGAPRVTAGPYRWLRHPNYVAVAVEGAALPLVHGAWLTAALFTAANAALLRVRIRCEERALALAGAGG